MTAGQNVWFHLMIHNRKENSLFFFCEIHSVYKEVEGVGPQNTVSHWGWGGGLLNEDSSSGASVHLTSFSCDTRASSGIFTFINTC